MAAAQEPNTDVIENSPANPKTEKPGQPDSQAGKDNDAASRARMAGRFISLGMWLLSISLVLLAGYLGWQKRLIPLAYPPSEGQALPTSTLKPTIPPPVVAVPIFNFGFAGQGIFRRSDLHTIIPSRPRQDVTQYTVERGDSVFAIAKKYNLKPETILWANFDLLEDSPDSLSVEMVLNIPPVDGVYYKWKEGDSLESVASTLKAVPEDILNWSGNKLDLTNPQVEVGQSVMVPGGEREFRSWIVPQIARGKAGVSKSVYGPGACDGGYEGAYGGGGFIWPAGNRNLSGNDFWSGHLGIDIAGGIGDNVVASDSGVIVFSGWATGGYGYMIMIDHGNGYQTLYAHLSAVSARCGQSVYQGGYIGAIGSTGNSTGSHLHFEIRLFGQFVNPWHVLP